MSLAEKIEYLDERQLESPPVVGQGAIPKWRRYIYSILAAELSTVARYFDRLVQVAPRIEDPGLLRKLCICRSIQVANSVDEVPSCVSESDRRTLFLFNGTLNHDLDIQGTLRQLRGKLSRTSRVAIVFYNPYLKGMYRLANLIGLRKGDFPTTFLTKTDVNSIAKISGYEVVKIRPAVFVPFRLCGIGGCINRVMPTLPLLKWFSLTTLIILRPVMPENGRRPSLSVVIPARNERGNIEPAMRRLACLNHLDVEVIFVEGHSSDGTWEEVERVVGAYQDRFQIKAYRQTGKGKVDAVRLGFSHATKDLLTILDADLTMPPELLHRFYDAYVDGLGDFVNGNRLTYPMEGEAMRFLNCLGNIFFAKALSFVLGEKIGDSLCGTKLVARHDYRRFVAWRDDFGDFDPFGDFELLFPAAELGLQIIDIPIRYRDRTYGSTNIRRFYHGWMLLKMTWVGLVRLKLGKLLTSKTSSGTIS